MKLSRIGRLSMALVASVALGLGMTACGGGTVGYMWVAGTQSTGTMASRIVGFKVDNYTGNLTNSPLSPYDSAGVNPVTLLVRPGGRFVYSINAGTNKEDGTSNYDGSISAFTVGGDGRLTFQASYGTAGGTPVWGSMDSSGSFLYVLDSLAPTDSTYGAAGLGDITAFSIASDTGRLSPITNAQIKDSNDKNLGYFPVGPKPKMTKLTSGGCLFVLDQNQFTDPHPTAIFPYTVTGGQLVQAINSQIQTNATNISSINVGGGNGTTTSTGGSYVYATDIGPADAADTPTTSGQIYAYTVGSNCSLNAVSSSPFANISPAQHPVWAQTITSGSRTFVYVLNQTNLTSSDTNSSISLFTVDSTGKLTAFPDARNPYASGAGPTCMTVDPTNQYLFTSNSIAGTVTGKVYNSQTGQLSDLSRQTTFPAVTHATCLAISGAVD